MQDFLKNILNYYAAFTETRFSSKSTLKYQWTNDLTLTLDISFLQIFRDFWLNKISTGDAGPIEIRQRQYVIPLSVDTFKKQISQELQEKHNLDMLKESIAREYPKETDGEQKIDERKCFLEGARSYNLSLRNSLESILKDMQKVELDRITEHYQIKSDQFPPLSFNLRSFTQEIFNKLRNISQEVEDAESYYSKITEYFNDREYNLVLFDLYYLLATYQAAAVHGSVYLFFDSIGERTTGKDQSSNEYPLFFIEVTFEPKSTDAILINIPNDFILVNTPAINFFEFDNVLTLPRASSFKESIPSLKQLDRFLDAEYQLSRPEIALSNEFYHHVGRKENQPPIRYRFGFQIIKEEDKRLLDYSELMTRIEKGMGSKLGEFVDTYTHGNVGNTTDEVEGAFRERYPKASPKYFITDNPLPLNTSQKRILIALANSKNKVIMIGGPPGTGKSHTIAAMIYWANQNNRSVVVASHKKEALDVVDRMLTDKFSSLHPQAKPSVIRLSKSVDLAKIQSLNEIGNSLAQPAIDAASSRVNSFPQTSLQTDKEKIEAQISDKFSSVMERVKKYPETAKNLLKYATLEEEIREKGLFPEGMQEIKRPSLPLSQDIDSMETFVSQFLENTQRFEGLSLDSLSELYKRKNDISSVKKACETINLLSHAHEYLECASQDILSSLSSLKEITGILSDAFDNQKSLQELKVSKIEQRKSELIAAVPSFSKLKAIAKELKSLSELKPKKYGIFKNKEYDEVVGRFSNNYPEYDKYRQKKDKPWRDQYIEATGEIEKLENLIKETCYNEDFLYRLGKESYDFKILEKAFQDMKGLRYQSLLKKIAQVRNKEPQLLNLSEILHAIEAIKAAGEYNEATKIVDIFKQQTGLDRHDYVSLFSFLEGISPILDNLSHDTINSLQSIRNNYEDYFKMMGIQFVDLSTLFKIKNLLMDEQKLFELIKLNAALDGNDDPSIGTNEIMPDFYRIQQRITEHQNDLHLKELLNFSASVERIKVAVSHGKRLPPDQAKLLLSSFACIIAEPEALFRYFPMEEDLIDILIFDEASQVSIAHSISLILRAKQVVVFGDEYQYGAVGAVTVNKKYSWSYFQAVINSYAKEFNISIAPDMQEKIMNEETGEGDEDDQYIPTTIPVDASQEWIKTFGIRNSTLNFCRAIANYRTTLTDHFRSFKEIIDYSNEHFYKRAMIPLVVNRLRTKPITEVLRFIKVDTQGNSGKNVNLDELEAIREDIERLCQNGYRGTVGIITSFKEQQQRAEKLFREKLKDYPRLREEQKLSIWFVGDVQGEERDIIYYSFVQDKETNNADLRTIYPTPNGTADTINSLKMQRLNVGFSRAKDSMVFVHSMDIKDYSGSRLGDALRFYWDLLEETKENDHFIKDDTIFDSPKEKELYQLLIQTDFYLKNKSHIRIIPQFDIGRYIEQEFRKYIPKYRVDFLVTLADGGKEHSLILEYDGLEYHTKDPSAVKSLDDFRAEYLEYDVRRQIELEIYGYRFLRINKFNLLPTKDGRTKVDVLNDMLTQAFRSER